MIVILLNACGGGGGNEAGSTAQTQAPVITASSESGTSVTGSASQTQSSTTNVPSASGASDTTSGQNSTVPGEQATVIDVPRALRTVALVVATDVLQAAGTEVDALARAIANERSVLTKVITAPSTAVAVRSALQNEQNLWGVMLIGDVPAPQGNANGERYPEDNPYRLPACPAYQFASDGNTVAVDSRILLAATECRNGNWTTRIKGRTPRTQLADVIGFLRKDLRLRSALNNWTRQYTYIRGAWFGGYEEPDFIKYWANNPLYSSSQISYVKTGTGTERMNAFTNCLNVPNEFCTANVHGGSSGIVFEGPGTTGEAFSNDVESLYSDDLARLPIRAKVIHLISCSTGNFLLPSGEAGYFAGNALFSGDTLLVIASTAVAVVSSSHEREQIEKKYHLLATGASFADIDTMELTPMQYFGDPTISLRPTPAGDQPKLVIDNARYFGPSTVLQERMPDSVGGAKVQRTLTLSNTGTADLKIQLTVMPQYLGVNNAIPTCRTASCGGLGFSLDNPQVVRESGFTDLGDIVLTIRPGNSLAVTYGFAPVMSWSPETGAGSPKIFGNYTGRMEIHSNDPELGRVFLEFVGNARAQ